MWATGSQRLRRAWRYPVAVARDAGGNLYISDGSHCRIRKVVPTGTIRTFAGTGICGYSGDGGPAKSATVSFPAGLAFDTKGNLLIFADEYNSVIRMISPAGTISTIAGNGIAGYSGDGGPATSANLAFPQGVSVDSTGRIYIADSSNAVIRMVDTAGVIHTVAGNHTSGFSGDGGPATSAGVGNLVEHATGRQRRCVLHRGHIQRPCAQSESGRDHLDVGRKWICGEQRKRGACDSGHHRRCTRIGLIQRQAIRQHLRQYLGLQPRHPNHHPDCGRPDRREFRLQRRRERCPFDGLLGPVGDGCWIWRHSAGSGYRQRPNPADLRDTDCNHACGRIRRRWRASHGPPV